MKRRHWARCRRPGTVALLSSICALALGGPSAQAAGPPVLGDAWASSVVATSATLSGEVNPNGFFAFYRFDYIANAAYEANLGAGKEGFAGALRAPAGTEAALGAGTTVIQVSQLIPKLQPETAYRYRLVAQNAAGQTPGPPQLFVTQGLAGVGSLPDGRGWEMVSPVEKNGGQIDPPGTIAGGGVLQASDVGGVVTFSSSASFGPDAAGAPIGSQYFARRGEGSWATEDVTAPLLSGSYGEEPDGVPYQLFAGDLDRGLLLNGRHCRGGGTGCAVANPPLPGSGAPAGYQNYYLRDSASGGFEALLDSADLVFTPLTAAQFDLSFAGASPDLRHVVLSTCAALTASAIEAPGGEGCDPSKPNLYEWSAGGLTLLNVLPAQSQSAPGATLAAQAGAVSEDGARVYWSNGTNLYLRAGGQTRQVDEDAGGGGTFQTASASGALAFFTKAGHLWRYDAGSDSSADLTPSGGVLGVLGASAGGDYVYYVTAAGVFLRHGATTTQVAGAADAGNYPPTTGTARVSADGTHVAFVSSASLTGYDNTDLTTGEPDSQVYLYDTATGLACISCNPTNGRPIGPSSIPGATPNGTGPEATHVYKPRVLVAGGGRLFFDSADALALADSNAAPDTYEWEAQGVGSCARAGGCVALISSGKDAAGASFADASADGSDAYFLTARSLVPSDPGSVDLYDARVGGGFPIPPTPIPCEGDNCQVLPSEPVDPALNTLIVGPGNPAVHYAKPRRHRKAKHRRHGRRHSKGKKQRGGRRR